ncbi:cation-transporting P-type ATPase [Clostridium thermarum]|uniref:P-type ATPase n=1 Tax=Clostridium thermarum TaxID=1716543 RepID=UPI0013D82813|nr:cation-transporting P-type ATPase [Clostridium thermarum]
MEQWYRSSWNKIVKELDSDIYKGLDEQEVQLRRKNYGSNKIDFEPYNIYKVIGKLLLQLWFIAALINAWILYTEGQKAAAIMVFIVTLTGLSIQIITEIAKYKNLTKVKLRNKAQVRAIRDGVNCIIQAEELVPGDIVILKKGSMVPADIRIIECEKLFVMEGSITGEISAVEKYSTKLDEEISNIANIKNMVFRSSVITQGSALGIVVATGMNTVDSIIIKSLSSTRNEENHVLKKMNRAINIHTLVVAAITLLCALSTVITDKTDVKLMKEVFFSGTFFNSVICGVLILNIIRIHIQNEGVQLLKPSSVFKLPKVGVLAMDKFGIISENTISLREIYTDGNSYFPSLAGEELSINMERMLQGLILCNSYSEFAKESEENYNYIIDKKIKLFIEEKLRYEIEAGKYKRLFINPYDHERRLMTYVYKVEGNYRAYTKGMLDAVADSCRYIMKNGIEVEFTDEDMEDIKQKAVMLESKGMNILAVAYRNFTYEPTPTENVESNMVFTGLIAINNPLKEKVFECIRELRKNNIKPVLFTEDTKLSAFTWGKSLGIVENISEVLSGVEMDNMSQEEYENYYHKIGIYSKLTPGNKAKVIKTYSEKGVTTAYICKGTEDLAPTVNSDIRIIKGENIRNLKNICDISIKNRLLVNLLSIIREVKTYIEKINKTNEFILTYLFSQFLLTLFISFTDTEAVYSYENIIWLAFFNLPFMISVMLIDRTKKVEEEEELETYIAEAIKPNSLKAYKIALLIDGLTTILHWILKEIALFDVNIYMILNLIMLALLRLYRIKDRKILSLSNLMYGFIVVFNLVLIFILNK